ncbi:hypothetical protein [Bacteroides sp. UBA939]|uniref:hypothetical protein n=1 Tax=Bacteroides sp. UBA939 TaxID=1946092 RepID=UPI0025BE58C5|nr:hypothetical protein [Bacteroides sp. UBA939]
MNGIYVVCGRDIDGSRTGYMWFANGIYVVRERDIDGSRTGYMLFADGILLFALHVL